MPALVAAPAAFVLMLVVKVLTKIAGVYPVTQAFRSPRQEGMYTTLLMSTGLTFGTISSLFGISHNIVDQAQYSALVAAVIASAVVPTLIANAWFLPRHHLPTAEAIAPSEAEATARPAPGRRA
jgi:Kef-type K+ transport system membrane component KefB